MLAFVFRIVLHKTKASHLPLMQGGNGTAKTLIYSHIDGFLGSEVLFHCYHKCTHISFEQQQTWSQYVTTCKVKMALSETYLLGDSDKKGEHSKGAGAQ